MGRIDLKIELPDDQMASIKVVEVRLKKSFGDSSKDEVIEVGNKRKSASKKVDINKGFAGEFQEDF